MRGKKRIRTTRTIQAGVDYGEKPHLLPATSEETSTVEDSFEPQVLLSRLYEYGEQGERARAIDLAMEVTETLLAKGDYEQVDKLLQLVDFDRLDTSTMITLLTITRGWKSRLAERELFIAQVEKKLTKLKSRRRARAMLKGLR